jgi:hypothetical protein
MASNGKANGKADAPVMFTIRQSVAYLHDQYGLTDVTPQAIRNAAKARDEFKTAGAVTNDVVEGTDITVLRLNKIALDAYAAARKSGKVRTGRGGAAAGAGVFYRVRLTNDQVAELRAAHPEFTFEPASVRQRKPADNSEAPADETEDHSEGASDDPMFEGAPGTGLLDAELIEG